VTYWNLHMIACVKGTDRGRLPAIFRAAGSWVLATLMGAAQAAPAGGPDAPPARVAAAASAPEPVSSSAQHLYEQARHQLVQVRTLLRGQGSQSSVGSGFFVGEGGLIVTNYHVVSQVALQPQRYRLPTKVRR
jgi:serine protease Do